MNEFRELWYNHPTIREDDISLFEHPHGLFNVVNQCAIFFCEERALASGGLDYIERSERVWFWEVE